MILDDTQRAEFQRKLSNLNSLLTANHKSLPQARVKGLLIENMEKLAGQLQTEIEAYDNRTRKVERFGPNLPLFSGGYYWFQDPHQDDIKIEDIAHALSLICRFNGQTQHHYSVAQHCVHLCDLLPDKFKLYALMHDASEAYLGDITRPFKGLIGELYDKYETKLLDIILKKYNIPVDEEILEVVHDADKKMGATERRDLTLQGCPEGRETFDLIIIPWDSATAEREFLIRFNRWTSDK